jgi:hypothetical protein
MKAKNTGAIIILLGFLAVSCRQDPIFFIIASETAPKKPRIEGAPTNIVVFNRDYPDREEPVPIMYVASGRLHWYAKTGANESRWDSKEYEVEQPGGKIIALAATSEYLYALCLTGHGISSTLRRIGRSGTGWEDIAPPTGNYPLIQSIHADPEKPYLFAGARNSRNSAALLYLNNDTVTLEILMAETAILSGAVSREEEEEEKNIYYLSTRGGGIFRVEDDPATMTINTASVQLLVDESNIEENNKRNNRTFMGMIKLENGDIIAIERNGGALYTVQNNSFARIFYTLENNANSMATGKYAIGALARWERIDPASGIVVEKLLIVGIQGGLYSTAISSYTHGYVEFVLNPDGSLNTTEIRRDPGRLQSLVDGNQDRYTASLGKHPINHLFQATGDIDENRTFFASTQTNGLWSYRDRPDNGGWQWNAED